MTYSFVVDPLVGGAVYSRYVNHFKQNRPMEMLSEEVPYEFEHVEMSYLTLGGYDETDISGEIHWLN